MSRDAFTDFRAGSASLAGTQICPASDDRSPGALQANRPTGSNSKSYTDLPTGHILPQPTHWLSEGSDRNGLRARSVAVGAAECPDGSLGSSHQGGPNPPACGGSSL
jgi:hypothetical protein